MTDIIERLKEPEAHYPGNFNTPKRAYAMLSCLCQEAAEEIEQLRQRAQCLFLLLRFKFALPNDNTMPSHFSKLLLFLNITLPVSLYLFFPKFRIRFGH